MLGKLRHCAFSRCGAADGRVVAGLQVPHDERHLVPVALEEIGYPYWDESDNPAYQLFLG